jgi:hypothetical protein
MEGTIGGVGENGGRRRIGRGRVASYSMLNDEARNGLGVSSWSLYRLPWTR